MFHDRFHRLRCLLCWALRNRRYLERFLRGFLADNRCLGSHLRPSIECGLAGRLRTWDLRSLHPLLALHLPEICLCLNVLNFEKTESVALSSSRVLSLLFLSRGVVLMELVNRLLSNLDHHGSFLVLLPLLDRSVGLIELPLLLVETLVCLPLLMEPLLLSLLGVISERSQQSSDDPLPKSSLTTCSLVPRIVTLTTSYPTVVGLAVLLICDMNPFDARSVFKELLL